MGRYPAGRGSGITPTTVHTLPSRFRGWFGARASAFRCSRQNFSDRRHHGPAPFTCSLARKARPRTGWIPYIAKYPSLTIARLTVSDSVLPYPDGIHVARLGNSATRFEKL